MSVSRLRFLALTLAAGGLVATGWLAAAQPPGTLEKAGDAKSVQTVESGTADRTAETGDGSVHVDAPGAKVTVDKATGKVNVTAPYTDVHVDPDKGRVKVRAPYVNLDVSW